MDKELRQATIGERTSNMNISPIKPIKFDKTNQWCITIWFWRTLAYYGYYHSRCINISWTRKIWKKNNVEPKWEYRDNGAKKENNDTCLDVTISLGYLQLNYVNWNLQDISI